MKAHNYKISVIGFILLFGAFTLMMAAVWEFTIHERVYNCTDSLPFGYFSPGTWVHGDIVYLEDIPFGRSMSEPDAIKVGWSMSKLWTLWIGMVITSAVFSWFLSRYKTKNVTG